MYSAESFLVYLASPQLEENQKQNARNLDFPTRDTQIKSGKDSNSRSVECSFFAKNVYGLLYSGSNNPSSKVCG